MDNMRLGWSSPGVAVPRLARPEEAAEKLAAACVDKSVTKALRFLTSRKRAVSFLTHDEVAKLVTIRTLAEAAETTTTPRCSISPQHVAADASDQVAPWRVAADASDEVKSSDGGAPGTPVRKIKTRGIGE
jgi:hypothetical protein